MGEPNFFLVPQLILERLDVAWSFLLLLTRYTAFIMFAPGLGGGLGGFLVRYPAALILALVSVRPDAAVPLPPDMAAMAGQAASEMLLGSLVAIVPLTIVAGAQTAGHLASGTMGLNAAQLIDPSTQAALPDLARIYSDFAIIVFLLVGGHYVAISELAGLNDAIKPGTFIISEAGLDAFVTQTARIFQIGCLLAAPVIVALLLTNFVMGIISKAVPTINIFIISFPLTIGVGLVISILSLPEVMHFLAREFTRLGDVISVAIR